MKSELIPSLVQLQFDVPGAEHLHLQVSVDALPDPGQPLLSLQQSLLRQPPVLQPHNLLHVHADSSPPHWSYISGKRSINRQVKGHCTIDVQPDTDEAKG